MEGGVDVEEIAKEDNDVRGIGEVKHIEEEPSCEEPLHDYRIQHKAVEDAHSQPPLANSCSDAQSEEPKNEPVGHEHNEVKPYQSIGPELEAEEIPEERKASRNCSHVDEVSDYLGEVELKMGNTNDIKSYS